MSSIEDLEKQADQDVLSRVGKVIKSAKSDVEVSHQLVDQFLKQRVLPLLKQSGGSLSNSDLTIIRGEMARLTGGDPEGRLTRAVNDLKDADAMIVTYRSEYAFRTQRLQLELARAAIAKEVVAALPQGNRGKLLVQSGSTILAGSAIGSALSGYLLQSGVGGSLVVSVAYAVAIAVAGGAVMWVGFREMGKREFEHLKTYGLAMGSLGVERQSPEKPPITKTEKRIEDEEEHPVGLPAQT